MNTKPISRVFPWLSILAVSLSLCCSACAVDDFYRARWALLLGVGEFKSTGVPALSFCEADVSAMRRALIERFGFPPENIVTLTDAEATKTAIITALSRLSDKAEIKEQDAVLVYFSGHGQTVPLPRGGEMGFLIPHDGAVDLNDLSNPARYYATCLGMDELRRMSSLIPGKHVLFLVDACYSGLAVESRRGIRGKRESLRTVAARPVRQIIVAGLKDEKAVESPAWGHGAFTYALLQGLKTHGADFNQDDVITGMELATYLRDAVPRLAPQTPQYTAFAGDGEFLLEYREAAEPPPDARPDAGPRILIVGPPDLAGDGEELTVGIYGDTVALRGLVIGSVPIAELSVAGRRVGLEPADREALAIPLRPTDKHVLWFRTQVQVEHAERKVVLLRARDEAGGETARRIILRAAATDTKPPDVLITELRTYDSADHEVDWKGLTIASKGLTMASKGLTMASKDVSVVRREGHKFTLTGFARDDRSVVSVSVAGGPARTRPADSEELGGLGWTNGVAFEGPVTLAGDAPVEVIVNATDAAGNQGQASMTLRPGVHTGPEIVILEPAQTRSIRGTGLMLPKAAPTVRIVGLARSGAKLTKVTIAGHAALIRAATEQDLKDTNWSGRVYYFSADVPVPGTGATESILVEAEDARGGKASRNVLVQRPGPPLRPQFSADRPGYRINDRVHLLLSSSRDAYIYIFHDDGNGALSTFLPNPIEPDCLLLAGVGRMFPNPMQEAQWQGQYGLAAQEPAGMDTVYCLALPQPLPASVARAITSRKDVIAALQRAADRDVTETDIPSLAERCGGTWTKLQYEVRR